MIIEFHFYQKEQLPVVFHFNAAQIIYYSYYYRKRVKPSDFAQSS